MKVYITGSIKINSRLRKWFFVQNIKSLALVSELFSWHFNIVGKYAADCKNYILEIWPDAVITSDNDSFYYQVVRGQIDLLGHLPKDAILFFLQEDHWFICPHRQLFFYLLEEFAASQAEVLRITHLTEFWKNPGIFSSLKKNQLFTEYVIDSAGHGRLCQINVSGYVTSLPGIFKKSFIEDLLENNKPLIERAKGSIGFELFGERAKAFLQKRSFIQMVPSFHVLREVFLVNEHERSMDVRRALLMIKARDAQEKPIRRWRMTINALASPRSLLGNIKRTFMGKRLS